MVNNDYEVFLSKKSIYLEKEEEKKREMEMDKLK